MFTVAPQLSVEQLLERWAARADEIRIVMGHFPLCTTELLGVPFTTMTVLRDPVERTMSFLRHHRKVTPDDRDTPFEAIYEDEFRFTGLIHNHMVKMFSLTPEEMTAGMLTRVEFGDEHLERAKRNLETIDVLGLQDRFEDFCHEVERRFGWYLGEPMFANRTTSAEVPASFRARIAEDDAARHGPRPARGRDSTTTGSPRNHDGVTAPPAGSRRKNLLLTYRDPSEPPRRSLIACSPSGTP
ncbi:MAG: hypothetical protein U5R31_04040 [Acidimicrobiia bacterium]|nr:hypothetical protein [Acidimicrobiia bacterium]